MAHPAPQGDAEPQRQRPGHLLDVLGEVGAARMRDDVLLGDRDDGTATTSVAHQLTRVVRDGRIHYGVLHGAEPTWTLLATATLSEACAQRGTGLRAALVTHAAVVAAWIQALDQRGPT